MKWRWQRERRRSENVAKARGRQRWLAPWRGDGRATRGYLSLFSAAATYVTWRNDVHETAEIMATERTALGANYEYSARGRLWRASSRLAGVAPTWLAETPWTLAGSEINRKKHVKTSADDLMEPSTCASSFKMEAWYRHSIRRRGWYERRRRRRTDSGDGAAAVMKTRAWHVARHNGAKISSAIISS